MASPGLALNPDTPDRLAVALLAALSLWLLAAAALVEVEYYDGIEAISNARYFAGQGPAFIINRSPMMAWLLQPAEWLHAALALHPLDFRPHHLVTALLHVIYLVGTYALLVRLAGRGWATLAAFAGAIPSFMFFTLSPFVSHDIAPGLALIAMLWLAARYADKPRLHSWIALVALGAAGALVKPTYGLLWLSVLVAHWALALTGGTSNLRRALPALTGLSVGAAVSAAVYWLAMGVVLASTMPDVSFLLRPLEQVRFLTGEAAGITVFPWWAYLRNYPAYGFLATALVLPALVMALRGDRLHRQMAIAWIVIAVALHLIALREVRYIAFLAPVTAFLMVRPIAWLLERTSGRVLVVALLVANVLPLTPYGLVREAMLVVHPFYRHSEARALLDVIPSRPDEERSLIVNWRSLSFAPPEPTPIAGDRYHRVFRLAPHHFGYLYGIGRDDLSLAALDHLALGADWPEVRSMVLTFGSFIVNPVDWRIREAHGRSGTEHAGLVRERVSFARTGDGTWQDGDGATVRVVDGADATSVLEPGDAALAEHLARLQFPRARFGADGSIYRLAALGDGRYAIAGADDRATLEAADGLTVIGYRIEQVISYRASAQNASN